MPPRTLPWLTQPKKKTKDPLSTSSPAPLIRTATPPSVFDLVDPDLNPTNSTTPPRRRKQTLFTQLSRSPSTSPPLAPPDVQYMRAGTGADDAWMMVEDEFLATASLYTGHLHAAAYAVQKRRAEAKGRKVLRTLERPTDEGRTARDGMVVEREEREKAVREDLGKDSEEEEDDVEELTDPLLGALMNDPKRMGRALQGVGKVKSDSRAAKGFLSSPEKVQRTFGVGAVGSRERVEDEGGSDAESDDLDGPSRKSGKASVLPQTNGSGDKLPRNDAQKGAHLFKKFTAASGESTGIRTDRSSAKEPVRKERSSNEHLKTKPDTGASASKDDCPIMKDSNDNDNIFKRKAKDEGQSYLAKRKQRKEEEEEAKRKTKERKASVEVPTFLF